MKPFHGLPLDLFDFDIVTLKDFNPAFVNTMTPDWVIYLAAPSQGFTGVITHDRSQLSQENEARVLEQTGISVITYRKGVADELTKWGLLMAYAPRIVAALDRDEHGAFVLPAPGAINPLSAGSLLHEITRNEKVSTKELRGRADREMEDALAERRKQNLWAP